MIKNSLILLLMLASLNLNAQVTLEKACNLIRSGDNLVKQQVEYKSPGRSGENVYWDFSQLKSINENYILKFYVETDSLLIGREHRTLYKYLECNDSLFCCGFENPTTIISNDKPELKMVFPLSFGDKHQDYFSGNGYYCNRLSIASQGIASIEADAYGMMILPTGDTLSRVIRTHHVKKIVQRFKPNEIVDSAYAVFNKDSVDYHLAHDSVQMKVDTYSWYTDGCRYPVFEVVESHVIAGENTKKHFNTAFYYTPVEQYYGLIQDLDNQLKRDEQINLGDISSDRQRQQRNVVSASNGDVINYNISKVDENSKIRLEYYLEKNAIVSVLLYDIQGRQLSGNMNMKQTKGFYHDTILLPESLEKEYVLRILVNEKVFGEKIIK